MPNRFKIKDLKISVMLLMLFSVTIIGIVLYFIISNSISTHTKIGSVNYNNIVMAKDLTADILPPPEYIIESYMTALQYLAEDDTAERDALETKVAELKDTYEERHKFWEENLENEEMRQLLLVDSYQYAMQFYDTFFNEVVPAVNSNDEIAISSASDQLHEIYDNHRDKIDKAVVVAARMATVVEEKANNALSKGNVILIIAMVIILLIGIGLFAVISYSISNPLKYISGRIAEVSRGNLSFEIDDSYISNSEIGQISASVKQMIQMLKAYILEIDQVLNSMSTGNMIVEINQDYKGDFSEIKESMNSISIRLRNTFANISRTAYDINGTAEQISFVSQSLSQGSSEQAGTLDELVSRMEEISAHANANSKFVNEASSYIEQSNNDVQSCYENMHQMQQSMEEINASSKEISKIIKVIEDIAFQTNILALNASVEAARAGTSGKGFAVVADEVRALATKCADAAHQTTEMVNHSLQSVNIGTQRANDTEASLNSVKDAMNTISRYIKDIEFASDEQLPAIKQVTSGFEQISTVVQMNSATAEESAASSEQLYANSSVLKDLVAQFVL